MRLSKIIIAFIFLTKISSAIVVAQTNKMVTVGMPLTLTNKTEMQTTEGSPFLIDEWKQGELILNDGSVQKLEMKYNIYRNQIHFLSEGTEYTYPSKTQISVMKFDKYTFIRDESTGDFFQKLYDGKDLLLLKKYICTIERGKQATGMLPSSKDSFRISESYYTKENKTSTLGKLKLKKENLLIIMNEKRESIDAFIEEENLSTKKEEDLVRIFEFYNSKP